MTEQISNYLKDCRVILVNTTHPGNVGAAARAMKTMGLSELYLVSDSTEIIDDHAVARASGANDLLENAVRVSSLKEAVAGCQYLLGTSARERTLSSPLISPREAAHEGINNYVASGHKIAILFGQERMGLTNQEIALCHGQILIPANPEYSSLNIASAVQLICYEFRLAVLDLIKNNENEKTIPKNRVNKRDIDIMADAYDMELFYEHLERLMLKTEFLDPKQPKLLMQRLRRLFSRTQVKEQELNILRGILSSSEKKVDLLDKLMEQQK